MLRSFVSAVTACLLAAQAHAEALSGVRIGAALDDTRRLGRPVATSTDGVVQMRRWHLPDDNELSVTAIGGRVVYAESDWIAPNGALHTDFPGLRFRRTSLADLRARFGSNGFAFVRHAAASLPGGDLLQVNCFELQGAPALTVAFVTRIDAVDAPTRPEQVGPAARLVSIIIARTDYLRRIWGEDRVFDPAHTPIAWR